MILKHYYFMTLKKSFSIASSNICHLSNTRISEKCFSRNFSSKANEDEKKTKKKKDDESSSQGNSDAERANTFIKIAERIKRQKIEFPPEEQAENNRIGREYNIQSFKKTNLHNKDLTLKIYLMQDAMNALPAGLREKAEIIDDAPVPKNRPFPNYMTPPIKGFKIQDYVKTSGINEE